MPRRLSWDEWEMCTMNWVYKRAVRLTLHLPRLGTNQWPMSAQATRSANRQRGLGVGIGAVGFHYAISAPKATLSSPKTNNDLYYKTIILYNKPSAPVYLSNWRPRPSILADRCTISSCCSMTISSTLLITWRFLELISVISLCMRRCNCDMILLQSVVLIES